MESPPPESRIPLRVLLLQVLRCSVRTGTLFDTLFIFKFVPQRVFSFASSLTYFPWSEKFFFFCLRARNIVLPGEITCCRHRKETKLIVEGSI